METTFIYALTEPGTRTIRYFGKASNPKKRRIRHIRDAKEGEKWHNACWIRKLLRSGKRPDVHTLCEVPKDDFARFERAFIALGRQHGFDLTNLTDGGEGPSGLKHSPESLAKRSAAMSGEKHPLFGKKRPQEFCDRQKARMTGTKMSPESCAKKSEAMKGEKNPFFGKSHPPEIIAKIAAKTTGQKRTPGQCAALRKKKPGASSKFYGVSRCVSRNSWEARISVSSKEICLGRFVNEIEAAQAYDTAAKKYHGAHAVLNFPD